MTDDEGVKIVSPAQFIELAAERERARQLEKAKALGAFKEALAKAVGRQFPDATEGQRMALAVNIFLCLDEVGIGLYVKEPDDVHG